MAKHTLVDVKIFLAGYDVSGISNSLNANVQNDLRETTTFGNDHRQRISGLEDTNFTVSGYWEAEQDTTFFNEVGATEDQILSFTPNGHEPGDVGYLTRIKQANYNPGASIGDVFAFTLEMTGNMPLVKGRLLADGSFDSSGNSPTFELPEIEEGSKVFCSLHVVGTDGSGNQTLDVALVSDDDGDFSSGATQRLVFDQFTTDIGAQLLNIPGPITDTHWRLEWNITDDSSEDTSFTIYAIFGVTNKI